MGWNKMSGNNGLGGCDFVDPSQQYAEEVETRNAAHEEANASWLFPQGQEALKASEPTPELEESERARFFRMQLNEDREGSWSSNPLEEPTSEDLDLMLGTFVKYKGTEWLQACLAEEGWDKLSDPWEVRAALRVAEREFLTTLF